MFHLVQSPENLEFAKSQGSCCLSVHSNVTTHKKASNMPLGWKAR